MRSGGHEGRPLAAAIVNYVHRVIHRMLGHAQTWDVVNTNVAARVSPPPEPETEIQILTESPDSVKSILHIGATTERLCSAAK